uniref:ZAD domain-containing protein n=1 Tax=Anopheles dirus TaxID=7168 RepID=A0A182N6R7_9DIPT
MTQEEVLLPPPANRYESCCRLCLAASDEPSCRLFPVHPEDDPIEGHNQQHVPHQQQQPQQQQQNHHPAHHRTERLIEMILECTSIQITLEEDYPAKVCEKCVETLDKFYQYRRRCLANDQILRTERQRLRGQRKGTSSSNNNNNNSEEDEQQKHHRRTEVGGGGGGGGESSQQEAVMMVVPAIRIKSEPLPLLPDHRVEEDDEGAGPAAALVEGGASSILRSILLQTRESTTSRSSPNTEPESPRQTPHLPPHAPPSLSGTPHGQEEQDEPLPDDDDEKDVKPSLLQQMLLQQQAATVATSPSASVRSPAKSAIDTNATEGPPGGTSTTSSSTTSCSLSSSSLLKRMLLDGSGTTSLEQPPLEGTSCQTQRCHRIAKPEPPPSATNTPSPPLSLGRAKEETNTVPSASETPLASQLRSILLQHRASALLARTASMSDLSPEQQHQPPAPERPEVSYVRSLFLRNDSDDSESEPPPPAVDDQREMLLYAMFQELRARHQHQQQQHPHQHQQPFSSDSDDDTAAEEGEEDAPQDYRLPCVRRRSTDSLESRGSSKRRRMEYPCVLCGRTFAGRTKLVQHMRTHMGGALGVPADGCAAGSSLGGAAAATAASAPTALHPAAVGPDAAALLANGGNEDEIDALERRSYACYICGADQNNLHQLKEHLLAAHQDRIRSRGRTRERQKAAQDFFCRLCASEGVLIHPLFPPGDNDPKDELVRMIEVLTSVHLTRVDDAGAVICDKCLQILDLFCKFREECLQQDVLIRTRRTLLGGQGQQLLQQQHLHQEVSSLPTIVEVKQESVEEADESAQPAPSEGPEQIICTPAQLIAPEECKEECDDQQEKQQYLVTEEIAPAARVEDETVLHHYNATPEMIPLLSSNIYNNSFPLPGIALYHPTVVSLSHPTEVPETPQDECSDNASNKSTICAHEQTTRHVRTARRVKRKPKPNFKKPPPSCNQCPGETFATYYEFHEHMNRRHTWDKSNSSSLACDPCQMRFTKSYNLKRHMYEVHRELPHGLTVIPCEHCGELFLRGNILERHILKVHRNVTNLSASAIETT